MSTLTRTELSRDARGNKTQTDVYESFAPMTPSTSASSWSITQEDGKYTLTEVYTEQVPDPGGGGGTTYPDIWSLDIQTVSEPIETFILFRNGISATEMGYWTQWKAGKEPGPDTYPSGFPGNSSNGYVQQLLARFNRGETDYMTPRITLKHQKVYSSPPSLTGVGYATDTVSGNPFDFASTVNFLFVGATCVQEGTNYRVTREWLTSRPGKWDSYIYGP